VLELGLADLLHLAVGLARGQAQRIEVANGRKSSVCDVEVKYNKNTNIYIEKEVVQLVLMKFS